MPGTVLDEVNIEMNKIFFPCSLWSYDFIKEKSQNSNTVEKNAQGTITLIKPVPNSITGRRKKAW